MSDNWVGIHICGGLIRAVPNTTPEEYVCSVSGCSGTISNDDYIILNQDDLPEDIHTVDIKSLPREKRAPIAQTNSIDEATKLAVEVTDKNSSFVF